MENVYREVEYNVLLEQLMLPVGKQPTVQRHMVQCRLNT